MTPPNSSFSIRMVITCEIVAAAADEVDDVCVDDCEDFVWVTEPVTPVVTLAVEVVVPLWHPSP
jgi:hypothetical protein